MKRAVSFQNHSAIELTNDSSKLLIAPDQGARILRWEKEGREIIHWPENADWNKILKVRGGNPVLFPFIARHFVDGKNELWRDAAGTVRPMPQHGFARDARFAIVELEPDNSLRMRLIDSEKTRAFYPFAFQFDVVVKLLDGPRIEIRFETTNRGKEPLPYYAGHHFYFAVPHRQRNLWTLELPCAQWGRQAPDGSVIHGAVGNTFVNLADPTAIDRYQIKPTATKITMANSRTHQRLVLDLGQPGSTPWHAVTTWTEAADSDFYCVEPWLGLPNAIHHGEGLRWVAPGKMEVAALVLDASGW